ncbi:MAG: transcriptional regulator [Methanomicrobia archaeon]|nr:transcriptional regulator [Methanomicrobia archaeon]MCK4433176.1 transcriptional regulator [Methanomicrobia archaeon]MCK4637111.1 transcriptional regulator [Methanomicrobia archaeon]
MITTVYDPEVVAPLRKSKVRRMVLSYLVNIYPHYSYPSEIARNTNLRATDVCGVLKGLSNRYKKENSLVDLGLVEKSGKKNGHFYNATKIGCKIWRLLNGRTYNL